MYFKRINWSKFWVRSCYFPAQNPPTAPTQKPANDVKWPQPNHDQVPIPPWPQPCGLHPWASAMMLDLGACSHLRPLARRVFLNTIFPHKSTLPWTHTNKIVSVKSLLTRLLNSDSSNTPHTYCLGYLLLNLCFGSKGILFCWAFDIPVFNRHPINIGSINKQLWVITLLLSKHQVWLEHRIWVNLLRTGNYIAERNWTIAYTWLNNLK